MSGSVPTAHFEVLTPAGRGAVATCRVVQAGGPPAIVNQFFRPAGSTRDLPEGRIVFGAWGSPGAAVEDVVLCRVDAQTVEIHCHGGAACVDRIVRDLKQAGCCEAPGKTSLPIELAETLTRTTTVRTAGILLAQQSGLLRAELERLSRLEDVSALVLGVGNLLCRAEFGIHLTQPWRIVLFGRPNAGKSTLLNALLGYSRSIVFDQPGTTRDVVEARTSLDGWPCLLTDTAGLHVTDDPLEKLGIAAARRHADSADLAIHVIDPTQMVEAAVAPVAGRHLIVASKADLVTQWRDEPPQGALVVSAETGEGVEELIGAIVQQLVPRVPPEDAAIPVTQRQVDMLCSTRDAARDRGLTAAQEVLAGLLRA